MAVNFDDEKIDIPCPNCGHKAVKLLGWLKKNDTFTCAACNKSVKADAKKLLDGFEDMRRKLEQRGF